VRGKAQRGRHGRGEAALHVGGAAPPDLAVGDRAGERIEAPAACLSRRHDVGMASENEVGGRFAKAGVEIVDARRPRRRERDDLSLEAGPGEEIL
jgi:hypothetical protein